MRVSTLPRIGPHVEAESERGELGRAPGRAGADDGADGQLPEGQPVAGDEHVAAVLAHRDGREHELGVGRGGQVLERVHGDVDAARVQRVADRRDEDAGAADGREQLAAAVALGRDLDELDLVAERGEPVGDPPRLGGGEGGAAGAEAQGGHDVLRFGGAETLATSLGSRSKSSRRAAA